MKVYILTVDPPAHSLHFASMKPEDSVNGVSPDSPPVSHPVDSP